VIREEFGVDCRAGAIISAQLTRTAILLACADESLQRLVFGAVGRRWLFWPAPLRLDAVLEYRF
jgi:hypothetical protein